MQLLPTCRALPDAAPAAAAHDESGWSADAPSRSSPSLSTADGQQHSFSVRLPPAHALHRPLRMMGARAAGAPAAAAGGARARRPAAAPASRRSSRGPRRSGARRARRPAARGCRPRSTTPPAPGAAGSRAAAAARSAGTTLPYRAVHVAGVSKRHNKILCGLPRPSHTPKRRPRSG